MLRIGLFSEDRALQPLLSSALGKGFQVTLSSDEATLRRSLQSGDAEVILVDLQDCQSSAAIKVQCCTRLLEGKAPALMVIMADDALRSTAAELVRLGAFGYVRRPPSMRDLKSMLLRASETSSLKRELQSVQTRAETPVSCDRLIGSSAQMQEVYDLIHRVAGIHASVLVTGESGTGKELIATAIHNLGRRTSQPFIAVSCGAIPETLIEAELFGHEKGAFTGTVGSRVGYLEQAGEGTLFLDEIGDLSPSTQVKLLRVLQQREFSRLGSTKLVPLRARLVFATHRDLGEMVAQGTFRQDLYYRINVMRIHAPSLSERREDITEIATHFLGMYSESYQKPMSGIEPEAIAALESYPWPGNVRELENIVQRAIILARGTSIRLEDLPPHVIDDAVISMDEFQPAGSFERQLRDYKIKLAVAAVREHHGNKTLAARSLQISRAYLHRLLRA
ncbi:MAG TPA: sigma-54 dependent transcriptional regulator, partial [Acidobacteriaceae bacterium]|nr:sigma-54 dependent transcriptional regulator [Acidobacteriaceae bacterium]